MTEQTEGPFASNVRDIIDWLGKNGHTYHVILYGSFLDGQTTALLKTQMPRLTSNLARKLFEGTGGLQSWSARIDLAYALGLIVSPLQRDLHAFRDLRNLFAHPPRHSISLDSEEADKLLRKFVDYDNLPKDRLALVSHKYDQCSNNLHKAWEFEMERWPATTGWRLSGDYVPRASPLFGKLLQQSPRHQRQSPDDTDTDETDPPEPSEV